MNRTSRDDRPYFCAEGIPWDEMQIAAMIALYPDITVPEIDVIAYTIGRDASERLREGPTPATIGMMLVPRQRAVVP